MERLLIKTIFSEKSEQHSSCKNCLPKKFLAWVLGSAASLVEEQRVITQCSWPPVHSHLSFVVSDSDEVPRRAELVPGDVEPVRTGEELVGEGVTAEEVDQALELLGILRTDISSLTDEVLGVLDTADLLVHPLAAEARIDDAGTDLEASRFQQEMTAIGQVGNDLRRGDVVWVLAQVEELAQLKVKREPYVIEILFHGVVLFRGNVC